MSDPATTMTSAHDMTSQATTPDTPSDKTGLEDLLAEMQRRGLKHNIDRLPPSSNFLISPQTYRSPSDHPFHIRIGTLQHSHVFAALRKTNTKESRYDAPSLGFYYSIASSTKMTRLGAFEKTRGRHAARAA